MIFVKSDRGLHPANPSNTTIPGRHSWSYGGGQTSMSAGYHPDCRTTIPKACAKDLFDVKRPSRRSKRRRPRASIRDAGTIEDWRGIPKVKPIRCSPCPLGVPQ
jgi:hypothetical protein